MDKSELDVRAILAGRAPKDAPVTVKGWVRTRRDSKAGISFVHLSDGSFLHPVQVVAPSTLPNYTDEVMKLTTGCAIEATGTIVPSLAQAIQRCLAQNGFCWVNTPIITASGAEGAGALFRVSTLHLATLPRTSAGKVDFGQDFFGREAFLTVSGQLNVRNASRPKKSC